MESMHQIPLYSVLPFLLMLASIAVLPLFANHFWERNLNKLIIALILGIPTSIWLMVNGLQAELFHELVFEYIPFIILLGTLFVITGGIYVDGNIESKPLVNTAILGLGAVLASFMGTTGAAMLLIRPILKSNSERIYKVHTVLFMIGIVANCGGLLTPLGDPPLFMMYLRGVPFLWFTGLVREWFVVNLLLLVIYYFVDRYYYSKEPLAVKVLDHLERKPIRIHGKMNFVWIAGVIIAIALLNEHTVSFIKSGQPSAFIRDGVILSFAIISLLFTAKKVRESNSFSWDPIVEVAYLFLGIFITMVPCLLYLETHARALGITTPALFYYATGGLSSFLDNTPTAVTFYSLAKGLVQQDPSILAGTGVVAGIPEKLMAAISVGAVMFGSITYIGNGPNFMIKAIAENQGVKMPHFFEYMYKFSLIVLLPLFILAQLLFI